MNFLSTPTVIIMHQMLIEQFGGKHGIKNQSLLESALFHPCAIHKFAQESDLIILAAGYAYHLIKNHAFIDGNKRIGTLAMLTFLKMNALELSISNAALYRLAMDIAQSKITEEGIAKRLKKYLRDI